MRAALEARGLTTKGPDHHFTAQCSAHDDRSPSLGVIEGDDGQALLKCYAGCTVEEVVAGAGLEMKDLFPPRDAPARAPRVVEAEYVYVDADELPIFKVVRFKGKEFRQARWDDGKWVWKLDGVERQIYHLPDVLRAREAGRWVFLTEGEKDADAVRKTGECGTTNPGGAGKWAPQYTETLRGAKVVILADDDEPGRKHAVAVYRELYGKADRVGIRLPAEGFKDIADHLAAGKSLNGDLRKDDTLTTLDAPPLTDRSALTARVFASRGGSDKALEILGPMFQRGMRTVVGAQTGEGKTTFALQAIATLVGEEQRPFLGEDRWSRRSGGARALIVDVEQGEETIKARLRESGLDTSDRVDVLWEPNGIALDRREEDRAMVRGILKDGGYDLVLLDPLYQLHLGSGNDEEVAAATMRIVDGWAREFNCALVIPMHARKPSTDGPRKFTKHDIAGTTTWLRNAEFILGLQLRSNGFSQLYFFKDRIGRGPEINSWWGLKFTREEGFRRNFEETANERRKQARKQARGLVERDEGATREEIIEIIGAEDQVGMRATLKGTHEQHDRYRTKPWTEQTSLIPAEDTPVTSG